MANITLSNNAQMNLEMEAMTVETAGHCDEWNTRHKQLLENDKYLYERILKDGDVWNSNTEYGLFTIVRHNGAAYISIQSSIGQEPSDESEYWRIIAKDGKEVTVDAALSETSTNPVQNQAVTAAITALGAPVLIQDTEPDDKTALWVK